jgi:hypothetical protein
MSTRYADIPCRVPQPKALAGTSPVAYLGSPSPEQRLQDLTKQSGQVDEAVVAGIFDELETIEPEFMIGKWQGGSFDTGHPTHQMLATMKWAGKDFRSVDDVDPIMLYDESGKRYWSEQHGHARVSGLPYRADQWQG